MKPSPILCKISKLIFTTRRLITLFALQTMKPFNLFRQWLYRERISQTKLKSFKQNLLPIYKLNKIYLLKIYKQFLSKNSFDLNAINIQPKREKHKTTRFLNKITVIGVKILGVTTVLYADTIQKNSFFNYVTSFYS